MHTSTLSSNQNTPLSWCFHTDAGRTALVVGTVAAVALATGAVLAQFQGIGTVGVVTLGAGAVVSLLIPLMISIAKQGAAENISLAEFIESKFIVDFLSEALTSPEDAEIFLLPEYHDDITHKRNNAGVIDRVDDDHKLVLVEGVLSMEELADRNHIMISYVRSRFKAIGWDIDQEVFRVFPLPLDDIEQLHNNLTDLLCRWRFLLDVDSSEQEKDMTTAKRASAPKRFKKGWVHLRRAVEILMSEIREQIKGLDSLEKEYLSIRGEDNSEGTYSKDEGCRIDEKEATRLFEEADQLLQNFKEIAEKCIKLKETVAVTFQDRNNSMIETLDKTEDEYSRRFVIAGKCHLIEEAGGSDPRYSVAPLRDYLRDKKAVILKHKECDEQLV